MPRNILSRNGRKGHVPHSMAAELQQKAASHNPPGFQSAAAAFVDEAADDSSVRSGRSRNNRKKVANNSKKGSKGQQQKQHDQMVADFFDVQPSSQDPNDEYDDDVSCASSVHSESTMGSTAKRFFNKLGFSSGDSVCSGASGSDGSFASFRSDDTPYVIDHDADDDDDSDEITLGSSFVDGNKPSVGKNKKNPSVASSTANSSSTNARGWIESNRAKAKEKDEGKKQKKKKMLKNFVKRLFGRKEKVKELNAKAKKEAPKAEPEPAEEVDDQSSVDFKMELSNMSAKYKKTEEEATKTETKTKSKKKREEDIAAPVFVMSENGDLTSTLKHAEDQSDSIVTSTAAAIAKEKSENDDQSQSSGLSLLGGMLESYKNHEDDETGEAPPRMPRRTLEDEKDEERIASPCLPPINLNPMDIKSCMRGPSSTRRGFSVEFSVVQIREFSRTVGDNPSCTSGPPISLGWEYNQITPDVHVVMHASRPHRTKRQFHLAASKRTNMLMSEWNVSEMELRKARREATYIQYCREKSAFTGGRAAKESTYLKKAQQKSSKSLSLSTVTESTASSSSSLASNSTGGANPANNMVYKPPSAPVAAGGGSS